MRKLFAFLAAAMLLVCGCTQMEIPSEVTDRLDNLEDRVTALETLCKGINSGGSSSRNDEIIDRTISGRTLSETILHLDC